MNALKENLEPLPTSMLRLPVDERGYAVPWFVQWVKDGQPVPVGEGKPEFRAMDYSKWWRAVKEKLCWVCGGNLGIYKAFVSGPMCGINRTSSEPPSHLECARWSARNCPFLSNPRMVRREDEAINNANLCERAAGMAITRNPGVALLWITRQYEIFKTETGPLIMMGEPESVEWYACGKPATRAQVLESIEGGLPNLEAVAKMERGGLEALEQAKKRFEKYIPVS